MNDFPSQNEMIIVADKWIFFKVLNESLKIASGRNIPNSLTVMDSQNHLNTRVS